MYKIVKKFFLACFILLAFTKISYADITNKKISYTDISIGNNEPLILIHAFPFDQQLWKPQIEGLKSFFRVITLDLWGFGGSEAVDGNPITMTSYADEVKQLMDQLHIQKAIIAGESMGGYVALAFLKKYPDQVSGLILSNTQSFTDSADVNKMHTREANSFYLGLSPEELDYYVTALLNQNTSVDIHNIAKNIAMQQSNKGEASFLSGIVLREDTSDILKNTTLPVLIIAGSNDTFCGGNIVSRYMHEFTKNSKLIILNHTASLANLEQSKMWNDSVIQMFYPVIDPRVINVDKRLTFSPALSELQEANQASK